MKYNFQHRTIPNQTIALIKDMCYQSSQPANQPDIPGSHLRERMTFDVLSGRDRREESNHGPNECDDRSYPRDNIVLARPHLFAHGPLYPPITSTSAIISQRHQSGPANVYKTASAFESDITSVVSHGFVQE